MVVQYRNTNQGGSKVFEGVLIIQNFTAITIYSMCNERCQNLCIMQLRWFRDTLVPPLNSTLLGNKDFCRIKGVELGG